MGRLKAFIKNWKIRLAVLFAVLGPGIITSNVDNDPGGIFTYSVCGAKYGYSLLWVLFPTFLALVVIQEMCARMGVVTRKGLADLIREEFGFRITFFFMMALLVTNFANIVAEFAGIAASLEIFGVNKYISVPIFTAIILAFVMKGSYRRIERIFLVACVFYVAYIISGVMVGPDWTEVMVSIVKPEMGNFDETMLVMIVGLVGTTIAPWMQFYMQASILEKGISIQQYKFCRLDVIIGSFLAVLVAFFIILTCAATLNKAGVTEIKSAADAAIALAPLAEQHASMLFAFGLFNAAVFSACILPLSTSYSICEGLGYEMGLDNDVKEAPHFYILIILLTVLGASVVLIPGLKLLPIILLSQVINGILLPVLLVFILILVNKKDLMGEMKNGFIENVIGVVVVLVMSLLSIGMVFFGEA